VRIHASVLGWSPSKVFASWSVVVALGVGAAGCDAKPALREWQPSDHQPPPTVTPAGQGEGSSAPQEADSTARAAAALWEMRCATCHGTGGRGDGPGRPPGAQLPDMTAPAYRTAHSDAELHAIIKQGRGLMPPFAAQLTDLGIDALIAHVHTLSGAP
jgi:mono/diheme cytochrome c family protein